jgi:hypothetical protein
LGVFEARQKNVAERRKTAAIQSSGAVFVLGCIFCCAGVVWGLSTVTGEGYRPPVFGYGLLLILIAQVQRLLASIENG